VKRVVGSTDANFGRPVWGWSKGLRPYAVPSRLWSLEPAVALDWFEPGPHLQWSGPARRFNLAHRSDRCRAYELVLREGTPRDIESIVDATLLREAWPDLALPRQLRAVWAPLIS
jgi:hypothetical protein